MTFNLYRNRDYLTKIDKVFFHNHYRVIKNEIKKCQGNQQDFFLLSLEKHTSFQVSLMNILISADSLSKPTNRSSRCRLKFMDTFAQVFFCPTVLTFFLTFLLPTVTFGFVLLSVISKGRNIQNKSF